MDGWIVEWADMEMDWKADSCIVE